jgi:hypothetical protein
MRCGRGLNVCARRISFFEHTRSVCCGTQPLRSSSAVRLGLCECLETLFCEHVEYDIVVTYAE